MIAQECKGEAMGPRKAPTPAPDGPYRNGDWLPVVTGIVIGPRDTYRDAKGLDVPCYISRRILPGPVPPGKNALKGWIVKRYLN